MLVQNANTFMIAVLSEQRNFMAIIHRKSYLQKYTCIHFYTSVLFYGVGIFYSTFSNCQNVFIRILLFLIAEELTKSKQWGLQSSLISPVAIKFDVSKEKF